MKENTYINREKLPFPFCPGCSHSNILNSLDSAMAELKLDPLKAVIVTDIGCVGLSDQWFLTHAFHGLHGRSVLYAEGLKLASPELHIIALLGDGGAGVGAHHLISAARRNIGITVILFNNLNFGMTGGEHSVTTPEDSITSTSEMGNIEFPFRLCETLSINGAPFTARRAFYDNDLVEVLKEAISFNGFSFVEIIEFCTAYYMPFNKFKKNNLESILSSNHTPRMQQINEGRTEYTEKYKKIISQYSKKIKQDIKIVQKYKSIVNEKIDFIIAGSAGQKIVSTTGLFAQGAIYSGLFAAQIDEYPVTVKTGYSISYLKLSSKKISYLNITIPDILIILSENGLKKVTGLIKLMNKNQKIFILNELQNIDTEAEVININTEKTDNHLLKKYLPLSVMSAYLNTYKIFPIDAFMEAVKLKQFINDYESLINLTKKPGFEIFEYQHFKHQI